MRNGRASAGGKVVSRTTHAEDLAQPVADTDRRIALLTTHRDRLAEIMKNRDLKVDQLITVSKELATVQTELDAAATERANLRRRLDTELLEIELSVEGTQYGGANTPVRDAIRSFTADFAGAVGTVISFVAMALPWLVVILPGIVLLRWFWRWVGRRLARQSS
jgi:predicted RNase H-like nuclease (RuvC/YqgF family)